MKVDIWIIGKPFDHCLQLFPKALQKMPAGSRFPVASVPILRMRSRLQVPTAFFRPPKAPAKPCRTPKLKQNLIAFVRTRRAEKVGSQWSARSDGPTGLRVDGGGTQARLRQNNGLQLRLEMSSAEERDRQQKQYKKKSALCNGIQQRNTFDIRPSAGCAQNCVTRLLLCVHAAMK